MIKVDPIDAQRSERVLLRGEVLLVGGHPRIADQHAPIAHPVLLLGRAWVSAT